MAIFSGDYWTSQWCTHELDLMLDRVGGNPDRVIAVVVHDSKALTAPIGLIQTTNLEDFRYTHMNTEGDLYQKFSVAMRRLAPHLCDVIDNPPAFDVNWTKSCMDRFLDVYKAEQSGAVIAPKWFKPPPPRNGRALPRLTP